MRSARLRFPPNISLLVKRATFLLLYFASGTSGRRTALFRLGNLLPPRIFKASVPLPPVPLADTRKGVDAIGKYLPNLIRTPSHAFLPCFLLAALLTVSTQQAY